MDPVLWFKDLAWWKKSSMFFSIIALIAYFYCSNVCEELACISCLVPVVIGAGIAILFLLIGFMIWMLRKTGVMSAKESSPSVSDNKSTLIPNTWQEFLKHSGRLSIFLLLFGILFSILAIIIDEYSPLRFLRYSNFWSLWIPAIVVLLIIPMIYSFIIKKSLKELAIITILFIVISSGVFLPLKIVSTKIFAASDGNSIALFSMGVFSNNPMSLVDGPICIPFIVINPGPNDSAAVCPLQKYGSIVHIIILTLISFIIVYLSMLAGLYLSNLRRTS